MSTRKSFIITEEETLENLEASLKREMIKTSNQDILQSAQKELRSEQNDRSSIVRNLSLLLLDIDSPTKILEIFERDYLNTKKDFIFVEELFMLLYFFKT
jgi:hypothetical protein